MFKYNFISKELLIKEYSKKGNTITKIARELKCSYTAIRKKLIKYKIEIKKIRNYIDGRTTKIHYCKDCGKRTCYNTWSYGQGRCRSCSKKGREFSEKHRSRLSLAEGGTGIPYETGFYPLEYFRIRIKILERDNYTCQLCNEYGNNVHHIDYNKQNNEEDNLICLCHKCNMKVNKNRNYWFAYFTYTMENNHVSL